MTDFETSGGQTERRAFVNAQVFVILHSGFAKATVELKG